MVELSKCFSNTLLQRKEYKTKNNVGNREEEGIEGEGTEKICHRNQSKRQIKKGGYRTPKLGGKSNVDTVSFKT